MPFSKDSYLLKPVQKYYIFKDGSLCEIHLTNNSILSFNIDGSNHASSEATLVGRSDIADVMSWSCCNPSNCFLPVCTVIDQAKVLNSIDKLTSIIIDLSKLESFYSSENTIPLSKINTKLECTLINALTVSCAFHHTSKDRMGFKAFENINTDLLASVEDYMYIGILWQHLTHLISPS